MNSKANENLDRNKIHQIGLPAVVLIKNYVEGHEVDYEEYLTEFINASKLVELNDGNKFILKKHNEQSHGECDLVGKKYSLDLKLLTDPKYMEAKSLLSYGRYSPCTGITCTTLPKRPGESMGYYDMIKVLRQSTLDRLLELEESKPKDKEEKVLINVLRHAAINKNVLFYLPFEYYYDGSETDDTIAKFISSNIFEDIKPLLEYRNTKTDKDTYIGYVSKGKFVIGKVNNKGIIENYPLVSTSVSEEFEYLYGLFGFNI